MYIKYRVYRGERAALGGTLYDDLSGLVSPRCRHGRLGGGRRRHRGLRRQTFDYYNINIIIILCIRAQVSS